MRYLDVSSVKINTCLNELCQAFQNVQLFQCAQVFHCVLFNFSFSFIMCPMDFLNFLLKSPSLLCVNDGLFNIFLKSPLLPCISYILFRKSITSMCKWWNFWSFPQKVYHSHVSWMDFLNSFPKSPSLPCLSDGLFWMCPSFSMCFKFFLCVFYVLKPSNVSMFLYV